MQRKVIFFKGSGVKGRWIETSRSDYLLTQHLISECSNIPLWEPHICP